MRVSLVPVGRCWPPPSARPGARPVIGRERPSDDRGAVGGLEVLPFGLLLFVAMSLVLANAWAVVDAKLAVEAAAREAGRAYVEAGDAGAAADEARAAAVAAILGAGRDPSRLRLTEQAGTYERCAPVEIVASYRVPAVQVPFVGGFGRGVTVRGRHREVIDPFAAGFGPENACGF